MDVYIIGFYVSNSQKMMLAASGEPSKYSSPLSAPQIGDERGVFANNGDEKDDFVDIYSFNSTAQEHKYIQVRLYYGQDVH